MEKLSGFYSALKEIKAIHFDMDGSLVDSRQAWVDSELDLLRSYGVQLTEEEIYEKTRDELVGRGQWFAARFYRENFDIKAPVKEIRNKRINLVKRYYGQAPLLDGAEEFVRTVCGSSVKVTLATSAPLDMAKIFLRENDLGDCFDAIVSDDQVEESKPSPEIFLKASEAVGVRPEESLVVEDSGPGLMAAKDAGALCLIVPNENLSLDGDDLLSRADFIVGSMAHLDLGKIESIIR